jgi:V/A-type H+/Na+-transporting ATPase subunit K
MSFGLFGIGAALALAAIGSAMGAGAAGMSAIGAWKKCYAQNRPAPATLIAFVGAPLTQTIYGYILMNTLWGVRAAAPDWLVLGAGIFGGIAMGASAYAQGKAGASAADALAETGKGFGGYIQVLGIVETVALLVMVFLMIVINSIG